MRFAIALVVLLGCGGGPSGPSSSVPDASSPAVDAVVVPVDAAPDADPWFFGQKCVEGPPPAISFCVGGGVCVESVCYHYCHSVGHEPPTCERGYLHRSDRGACYCTATP